MGVIGLYHASLVVQDLLYHMGLIIITAIDYGTEGSRLLDHCTGKALTEGVGRKLYLMHIFCAVKTSDILIGKIDAGTASKVKRR